MGEKRDIFQNELLLATCIWHTLQTNQPIETAHAVLLLERTYIHTHSLGEFSLDNAVVCMCVCVCVCAHMRVPACDTLSVYCLSIHSH